MNLKIIWTLIKKEALLIFNDKSILLVLFAAPLLYLFLMGTAYINKDEEQVSVGVVDYDHSKSSRTFLNKINTTQKIALTQTYTNVMEAQNGISKFDIQGYIHIPKGFEKNLINKESAPIGLVLNNTRFLPSNDINKTVNLVALDYAQKSRADFFKSKNITPELAEQYANPVSIQVNAVYNSTNNYGDFLLPFVLFLILHQTILIGLSESIASDREKKILSLNFKDSNNSFINYILGKIGLYFLLFLAYTILVLLVVFPAFHLPLKGNLLILIGVASIFILTTLLMGWFIASFFTSETRAMEVIAFTSYPVFLITGVTWSLNQMPLFIQYISNLIPLNPFFVFLKKHTIMGIESRLYYNNIIHLLGLLILAYVCAYLRHRYLQKQLLYSNNKTEQLSHN